MWLSYFQWQWQLDFPRYFVDQENSVKNVATGCNCPPSLAKAALCYISQIHEPTIIENEQGGGVKAVTCESLNSREFLRFFWNFTSRSWVIFISLSLRDLDFQSFLFHFHFLKRAKRKKFHPFSQGKRVKFDTKFHNKINHSRRVQNPKQSTSGIIF